MSIDVIDSFRGPYRFLSNFDNDGEPVVFRNSSGSIEISAPTSEHIFQALKTRDLDQRAAILAAATPGEAKRLGRACTMRPGWESGPVGTPHLRIIAMRRVLRWKFSTPARIEKLLATGNAELIEGNDWGDQFWGVSRGGGLNWLGRLLMERRAQLRGGVA